MNLLGPLARMYVYAAHICTNYLCPSSAPMLKMTGRGETDAHEQIMTLTSELRFKAAVASVVVDRIGLVYSTRA